MRSRFLRALALAAGALLALAVDPAQAATGPVDEIGSIDGAPFQVEIPSPWNGTLVLYSHGYVAPGSENPARDAGDPVTHDFLLAQKYALDVL